MGFPREVGRKGSTGGTDTIFAKTWFETSVGKWSARTGKNTGFLIACLALLGVDSSAHNPEVVGSSPASATKELTRYLLRIPGFLRLYGGFRCGKLGYWKAGILCFPYCFPYAFTAFMNCSSWSALSRFIFLVTWPYTSRVKAAVAWPRFSCTVLISLPDLMEATA